MLFPKMTFSRFFKNIFKNTTKFLSLLFLVFFLFGCDFLQQTAREYYPDISLKSVNFHSFDMQGIDLKFSYNVHNKAAFPINLSSLAFKLFADDNQVANVKSAQKISIPANGNSDLQFIQRVQFKDVVNTFSDLAKKDKLQMKLDGNVGFILSQTLGSIDVPINAQKEIPVPKLPKMKVVDFRFVNSEMNIFDPKATFNLKLSLQNPNSFPLDISRLNYKFNVEGKSLFDGMLQSLKIESGKTSVLNLPITLQGGEMVRLLPKLQDFSSLDYKFVSDLFFKFSGQELKIPLSYPQ